MSLCRDVLGNLPRIYFGKSRAESAWMKLQSSHINTSMQVQKIRDEVIGLQATTIVRCIGPLYGLQKKTGFHSSASGQMVLHGVTTALTDKGPLASEKRCMASLGFLVQY